jgi:anti-sigma B factor antagonist
LQNKRFLLLFGRELYQSGGVGSTEQFCGPIEGGPVDLSVLKQADVQVLRLRGRLTLGEAVDAFKSALDNSLAAGDAQIIVNVSEVPLMDSSGIGVLVRSQSSARAAGGSIKLVQPSAYTLKTLKMVGLLDLFEVYDSEEDAVASFSA